MIQLTQEAQRKLDRYLRQVRSALQGVTSIDPGEVEQEVNEHIKRELEGHPEPVSLSVLETVLQKLGKPNQWVREEELPLWRRIVLHLRWGPEDWRLTYVSFGLFFLWLLTGLFGLSVLFLFASFLLARAVLSASQERESDIGAQRWLIFPPLVVLYLFVFLLLFFFPLKVGGYVSDNFLWPTLRPHVPLSETAVILYSISLITTVYWLVISLICWKWRKLVQVVFLPFADWFSRVWARRLLYFSLALFLVTGGIGASVAVGYLR